MITTHWCRSCANMFNCLITSQFKSLFRSHLFGVSCYLVLICSLVSKMLLFSKIILQVYEVIVYYFSMCIAAVAAVEGDLFMPGLLIQ